MLNKIGAVIVTVYTWIVWLLGIILNSVKMVKKLSDLICRVTFVLAGTAVTITSVILIGLFCLKCYLATGLILHLVALGILILMSRGAWLVWHELKDTEVDAAFTLFMSWLLSGIVIIWESVVWLFQRKETE